MGWIDPLGWEAPPNIPGKKVLYSPVPVRPDSILPWTGTVLYPEVPDIHSPIHFSCISDIGFRTPFLFTDSD